MNCNMTKQVDIGVFKGKKASHNAAILEVLLKYGPLKNWDIAKRIYENNRTTGNPHIGYAKTQGIYSVIIRKKGRLDELNKKDYIMKNDSKWELCFPKGLSILVYKPGLISDVNEYYLRKPIFPKSEFSKMRKLQTPFGIKLQIDMKQLQRFSDVLLKRTDNLEIFQSMARSIESLVHQGIDLDRINDEHLFALLIQGMRKYFKNLTSGITPPLDKEQ